MDARETCLWIADIAKRACKANGCPEVFDIVKWNFSPDMKKAAGKTEFKDTGEVIITLSLPLWFKATEGQREWVIVHEICHVISAAKDPRNRPHGKTWKKAMVKCNAKPLLHHSIPIPVTALKLQCCNDGWIGQRQYARLITGETGYKCGSCGCEVTPDLVIN